MTVTAIVGALSRLRERVTVRVPLLVALAFIAGFSERLSRGVISTVEGRFVGTKSE